MRRCCVGGTCGEIEVDRLAGFVQDAGEGVDGAGEKSEEAAGVDFASVDGKGSDGVLDLKAGVGVGKLVGELNFVGGVDAGVALGNYAQRKKQEER